MSMDIASLEQRSSDALTAYEEFVTPLMESGAVLTEEQRSQKNDLLAKSDQADENLTEGRKLADAQAQREERKAASEEHRTGVLADVSVVNERAVYSRESRNSYIVDRVFAGQYGHPLQAAAQQRLDEHGQQIAALLVNGSDEARKIEQYVRSESRSSNVSADEKLDKLRKAGVEQRTGVTTATGSGGAWVVPVWLLDRTIYYNLPSRPFLNALDPIALPPSGMTINVPAQTGPAATGVHSTQNSAIVETDVTSSTVPIPVQPIFGGQTVSLEQLERESWNGSFDQMIMRSLQQAYDQECDQIALAAALTGATSLAYSGTFSMTTANGAGGFYEKVAGAIATVETAAGVLAMPNAMFVSPQRWAWMLAQADANSRPLVVPTVQGPNNAVANATIGAPQGLVGSMLGLDVYKDLSIPTIGSSPTTDQAVVLDTT